MSKNKLVAAVAGLVLVMALAMAGVTLFNRGASTLPLATPTAAPVALAPTQAPSPTAQVMAALAVSTPVPPTDTPVPPPPTDTASPVPPTASATPTMVESLPAVTQSSSSKPAPKPTTPPKPAAKDPNILPNGVRYGDHYPKLPDRIVRIASPNIKLDAKVYEVYAVNGAWEVADYAAGHNYNSANPGEGGNIVLAGHNNWRGEVFRYLEFLKPGNEIDVWTLEGKEYKYQVEDIQKLKEAGATMAERLAHGHVMDPTPFEQLTLITCWPYTTYTHRLIVTAKPMN